MCGLVGVAGNLIQRDVNVFKQLLHADYLRGVDSTGVASITHGNEVRLFKMPVDPVTFFSMKRAGSVITATSKVLMGHNRAATRGELTVENSHPFWTGKYMVAHNGTLDYSCLKDLAKNRHGNTDSEQLVNSMHELNSIKDAVALAGGAWALSIYDHEDNTISLLRNDQRPLYYAMADDRDTLYWASEPGMLRWILDRNDVNYNKKIIEVSEDTLLTWGIPGSKQIFMEKPHREEVKGKRVTNFHRPYQNEAWRDWSARPNVPTASGAGSNNNTLGNSTPGSIRDKDHAGFSEEDVRALRAAPFSEVEWEIYGLGWQDAEAGIAKNNPFQATMDFDKWDRYEDGYKAGTNRPSTRRVASDKIDNELPFLLGDGPDAKARKEAQAIKEAAEIENVIPLPDRSQAKVILVGDLKPQIGVFGSRIGPEGKRITPRKFQELTGHKCGWCDNPFGPSDKGHFEKLQGYGTIYVADCCADDPDVQSPAVTDVNPPKEKKA